MTGLSETLQTGKDYTVFAPNNFAFDVLGRDKSLANLDELRRTLLRHVVRARLSSLRIPSGVSQVETAAGDKVW